MLSGCGVGVAVGTGEGVAVGNGVLVGAGVLVGGMGVLVLTAVGAKVGGASVLCSGEAVDCGATVGAVAQALSAITIARGIILYFITLKYRPLVFVQ